MQVEEEAGDRYSCQVVQSQFFGNLIVWDGNGRVGAASVSGSVSPLQASGQTSLRTPLGMDTGLGGWRVEGLRLQQLPLALHSVLPALLP